MEQQEKKQQGAEIRAFYHSGGTRESMDLGAVLGRRLKGGDCLLLSGPVGAGKTWLTHGIAEGLEIKTHLQSPSFTLMFRYESSLPDRPALLHFDAYRLSEPEEWIELGFHEYPGENELAVIEWPERVREVLPKDAIEIKIEPCEDFNERKMELIFPKGLSSELAEDLKALGVRFKEESCFA